MRRDLASCCATLRSCRLCPCSSQGASRTVLLQDTQDLAAGDVRHLSNAVRVPKDYANLRRGQTLPGQLAHVLGDLTRVDLQPRRRRPPVRQSRLRDTLPVSRKASRRGKPEAHKLTSTQTLGGSVRRGAGRAAKSKAAKPAGRGAVPAAASDAARQTALCTTERTPCCACAP